MRNRLKFNHFAEGTRFELVVQNNPYGSLANCWFQPLTHPSGLKAKETHRDGPGLRHKGRDCKDTDFLTIHKTFLIFVMVNRHKMKAKSSFWVVPALFFLVAAGINIYGKAQGLAMADTVKPALLPLLAATTLVAAGGADSRNTKLLLSAQLLGCVGDTLLLFTGFLPFIGGMAAFLLGHLCYISLFGHASWKGLGFKTWIPALVIMACLVAGLVHILRVEGDLLLPMCVYGMILMLLIFSGLAGIFRCRENAWWLILAGTLLFTFSDSLIALETFSEEPVGWTPATIMATYLAAQALLAAGALRIRSSH